LHHHAIRREGGGGSDCVTAARPDKGVEFAGNPREEREVRSNDPARAVLEALGWEAYRQRRTMRQTSFYLSEGLVALTRRLLFTC
jgi:hypothetical protein